MAARGSADQFLTQAEVAEELRIAEGTLQNWRYLKVGPAYIKVGRAVRYPRSALTAYYNQQTVSAA